MKNHLTRLLFAILISIFIIGCEKEDSEITTAIETEEITKDSEVKQEAQEEIVDISHTYYYRGEKFKVTYTLNQKERDVIKTSGDVDMAKAVFGKEDSPKALLFENPEEGKKEIGIRVFDTDEEMNRYVEKNLELPKDIDEGQNENDRMACSSYDYWGNGSFYFYKHAYYNTEMTSMRRTSRRATGNHWVGSANNDNLSSVIIGVPYAHRGYLRLKQHSCYNGKSLNFYIVNYSSSSYFGVANLQWYTLSGWWWWRTSWNDQVSSYKGWCWK